MANFSFTLLWCLSPFIKTLATELHRLTKVQNLPRPLHKQTAHLQQNQMPTAGSCEWHHSWVGRKDPEKGQFEVDCQWPVGSWLNNLTIERLSFTWDELSKDIQESLKLQQISGFWLGNFAKRMPRSLRRDIPQKWPKHVLHLGKKPPRNPSASEKVDARAPNACNVAVRTPPLLSCSFGWSTSWHTLSTCEWI